MFVTHLVHARQHVSLCGLIFSLLPRLFVSIVSSLAGDYNTSRFRYRPSDRAFTRKLRRLSLKYPDLARVGIVFVAVNPLHSARRTVAVSYLRCGFATFSQLAWSSQPTVESPRNVCVRDSHRRFQLNTCLTGDI